MDRLHVNGIRGYGYTGLLPEEQRLGQWFEVDLTLMLDLSTAGQSDRLEETLDYRHIIAQTQTLIQTARFSLVETLATAIAEMALKDAKVQQVKVHLTKVAPPIPNFSGNIQIELTRAKHDPKA
jgi:7,8-dihydroneopterin aldolase/epimerase/oxygenase